MLNIGKLAKGQQDYYLRSVAKGVEDYYVGSGEAPGYWIGGGADDLGLSGQVLERELTPVLEGRDPETGEAMNRRHHKARMPGFDLTFRAPKSVALFHALGDKEASNEVVNAHDAAVVQALDYLERSTAYGRRGTDGLFPIGSSGFVAAAFRHRTSRAGDPLLHTHVLVANLIHGDDGKWSALDGRLLYSHAKTAGYLYQSALRLELTERLGMRWTTIEKGTADLEGIPRAAIKEFSRRRTEIEIRMEQRGEQSARAAQVATLDTRRAKNHGVKPEGLLPEWEKRAKQVGLSRRDLDQVVGHARTAPPRLSADAAAELFGPEGLTRDASSFTVREVMQALCERYPQGAGVDVIERDARELLDSNLVVKLPVAKSQILLTSTCLRLEGGGVVPSVNDDVRYSTKELLRLEERLIRSAVARADDGVAVADKAAVRSALDQRGSMSKEQRQLVSEITRSGRGVEVVVGKAGSGKTFALDAARDSWERSGMKVIGCALSARAAKELEAGSGIESSTIAALMRNVDDYSNRLLERGSVIVVDEAGMVGTRQLDALLDRAAFSDAKVVLVGDDKQLPEIAAGGAFRALKEELSAVELSEVRRQTHAWEREALELLRDGRSAEAIELYREQGCLIFGRDAVETRARLVTDWWTAAQEGSAVMVAARRADVDDLNEKAQAIRRQQGCLGEAELRIASKTFYVGDEVMALRNDRSMGLTNGSRATVEALDPQSGEMTLRLEDQRAVVVPGAYVSAGNVTLAYAITGHKAQGMTTDRALVLGDESMYREWGYVAMSRGREENRLYAVMGDGTREEVGGAIERPHQVDQLMRALQHSKAKSMAFDAASAPTGLDRASLKAELERTYAQLSGAPRDMTGRLEQLREQKERTQSILDEHKTAARNAREKLDGMSQVSKARKRREVEQLREGILTSHQVQDRLTPRLRDLANEEKKLVDEQSERARWLEMQSPLLERADQMEKALGRRNRALIRDRENCLPKYLENAFGHPPEFKAQRSEWRRLVLGLEDYRDKFGIKDRRDALGPQPRSAEQRQDREEVARQIERWDDSRSERAIGSSEPGLSLERSGP